jgi:tripartite-type tricarboxylate transporter receptor subunit TctC
MTIRRRQFLRLAGAAVALPFAPYVARAQGWPNKTIRLIAPFSAGSTSTSWDGS